MGLLDKIFCTDKTIIESLDRAIMKLEADDSTSKDLERLQSENKIWEKDFNAIISLRQNALQLEKEKKLEEAIEAYLSSIRIGEDSVKLNINNYAHDIDRLIVLYSKTKQTEILNEFLNDKISKYPNFNGAKNWIVRLSKLNGKINTDNVFSPNDIVFYKPNTITLGCKFSNFKKSLPEFNFYYNMPEGMSTFQYQNKVPFELSKKLAEFKEGFKIIIDRARVSENEGNFKTAIEAYERLIEEEYEDTEPYERLILIYSKLKWKEQEISTIERAISFFTELKRKQLEYVYYLADKYGMRQKASEYIMQDKKIFYYLGAFELYNPQTTKIKKWKERLQKKK
jgi:tetratricopeptide (TPR) repeat protein